MTQQNAAMVEESTAAAHSLASEAANLSKLVGQFRLDGGMKPHASEMVHFPTAKSRSARSAFAGNTALQMAPAEEADWAEF